MPPTGFELCLRLRLRWRDRRRSHFGGLRAGCIHHHESMIEYGGDKRYRIGFADVSRTGPPSGTPDRGGASFRCRGDIRNAILLRQSPLRSRPDLEIEFLAIPIRVSGQRNPAGDTELRDSSGSDRYAKVVMMRLGLGTIEAGSPAP